MLYIDKATILKFDLEMLKKHRRAIQFIAVLLFIVGLLCISFPFVSGDILSTVVGALLICSGIALIVGLFSNRSHNFWPVLSGFLVAVAYLLIGYFFIRAPELGIFAIAAFIAGLFCVAGVIDYLHYYRSFKTEYELACMREAQKMAVNGHRAAEEAFRSGMSEFDINIAYLTATGHRDTDVPYSNIVALNEHAAVLHYTKLDHQAPEEMRSFLLDAGAEYNGYAADLTRTWSAKSDNDYAQLVKDVNDEQLALIATMKAGVSYVDYHIQFHQRIAKLLRKHQIITDMSEEAMVENDLTGPFMPHGIGHPLGLQVHDVAGFMQDDSGTHLAAPAKYPYLRCTRILQPGMLLTIEPGIYFIESLLAPWREGQFSKHFNWQKIEALKPFGGIRIEDNVVIHENNVENMTRDLKLA